MGNESSCTKFKVEQIHECEKDRRSFKVVTRGWAEEFDDELFQKHVAEYCKTMPWKKYPKAFKKASAKVLLPTGKDGEVQIDESKKVKFYVSILKGVLWFLKYRVQTTGSEKEQQYRLVYPDVKSIRSLQELYAARPFLAEIFERLKGAFADAEVEDIGLLANVPEADMKFNLRAGRRTVTVKVVGQKSLSNTGSGSVSGSHGAGSATGGLSLTRSTTKDIEKVEYGEWSCQKYQSTFEAASSIDFNYEVCEHLFNQLADLNKQKGSQLLFAV